MAAYSSLTLDMDTAVCVNMEETDDDGGINALVDWIFLSRSRFTAMTTKDLVS